MVNRTGPRSVAIVRWGGHYCVLVSHSWPNVVTTRACSTKACVNAFCAMPGCLPRPCTIPPDIAVVLEQESTSTSAAAEAPGTSRRSAKCCVRPSTCVFSLPNPRSFYHICRTTRLQHALNKISWNLHATAVTRLLSVAPRRSKNWCCIISSSA